MIDTVLTPGELERARHGMRIPTPPPLWRVEVIGVDPYDHPIAALVRDFTNGMRAIYTIDPMPSWRGPTALDVWWRHATMSRRDRYPSWEDQRDMVYALMRQGLFDPAQPVIAVIPPLAEYVGELGTGSRHIGRDVNPNVFHWWQPEVPS